MSNVYGQTLLDDMVHTQALPMPLVKQAAREILAVIREGLISEGVVNVSNFGTFRLKLAATRQGFNPQTKQRITIPAHQRVIFSPCKALRELIQPVHLPVVPIEPEVTPHRAAARSAPIAPVVPIATKRIVPTEPKPLAETKEPTPDVLIAELRKEAGAGAVADSELPLQHPVSKAELQTSPELPVEPVAEPVNETMVEVAPAPEPTAIEPESRNETGSDIITLEMGEKIEKVATRISSKKYYYLGAAAVLVIAVVGASLLRGPAKDVETAPANLTATIQQIEAHAPVITTIESKTESAETVATSQAEALAPVVEPSPEAIDSSTLYTEMASAMPVEEPVVPSGVSSESNASNEVAQLEPAASEPTTISVAQTPSFFFSEQSHKIQSGESLWRLARQHYKKPLLWPHIYQANAAVIDNPDHLREGRTLVIPSLQGSPDDLTSTDRRNIAEGYYLTYLHYKKTGHKDAFFALLEAKRYDNKVVEEHRSLLQLSKVEEIMLEHQGTMPF